MISATANVAPVCVSSSAINTNLYKKEQEEIFENVQEDNLETLEVEQEKYSTAQRLQAARDKQGFTGKAIDFVKSLFGCGSAKLEVSAQKVEQGKMSESEFEEQVQAYEENQADYTDRLGTVAAGIGAVGVTAAATFFTASATTAAVAVSWPVVLTAAGVAAVAKLGVSFFGDEVTNNIEGDATFVQGCREFGSGFITGFCAAGSQKLSEAAVNKIWPAVNNISEKAIKMQAGEGMHDLTALLAGFIVDSAANPIETIGNGICYSEMLSQSDFLDNYTQSCFSLFGELIPPEFIREFTPFA